MIRGNMIHMISILLIAVTFPANANQSASNYAERQ